MSTAGLTSQPSRGRYRSPLFRHARRSSQKSAQKKLSPRLFVSPLCFCSRIRPLWLLAPHGVTGRMLKASPVTQLTSTRHHAAAGPGARPSLEGPGMSRKLQASIEIHTSSPSAQHQASHRYSTAARSPYTPYHCSNVRPTHPYLRQVLLRGRHLWPASSSQRYHECLLA
jgi:hypothetical protein